MRKKINNKGRNTGKQEVRVSRLPVDQKFTVRTDVNTGARSVAGYFANFNVLSRDLGFREKLLPGCFAESLKTNGVRCLMNHDPNLLLGRTESGTLDVREDDKGLAFRVQLPRTSYASDLVELLSRGDSYECSFAFVVPDGGDTWEQMSDGTLLRTINRCLLTEGSILLSEAAYPLTSANIRSLPKALRGYLDTDALADDDSDCDPDVDDDCEDNDEDRSCSCSCSCKACEAGSCDQCSNDSCDDETCADNECPAASETRSLRKRLDKALLRRIDDLREAAYASDKAWVVNRLRQLSESN